MLQETVTVEKRYFNIMLKGEFGNKMGVKEENDFNNISRIFLRVEYTSNVEVGLTFTIKDLSNFSFSETDTLLCITMLIKLDFNKLIGSKMQH